MNKERNYRWQVLEGIVDTSREHIKVICKDFNLPYALLQFGRCRTIVVQYFCGDKPWYKVEQSALSKIKEEITYYLFKNGEANPWQCAVNHARLNTDSYSEVRWLLFKDGGDTLNNEMKVVNQDMQTEDNNPAVIQYKIGRMYLDAEEYDEAITAFNRAIEIDDSYILPYLYRSTAFCAIDELELAIADCDSVLKIDPLYDWAYSTRGYYYFLQDMIEKTIEDCNMAIKLRPTDAGYYENRGRVYLSKGDYEMAIKDFDAAIEICPDDSSPYEYKAAACMEINKPDLAKEYYEEALKVDPCNILAFAKLAQLRDCEKNIKIN